MLTDAHSHIRNYKILDIIKEYNIFTTVCAMSPEECLFVEQLQADDQQRIIPTFGLHPWNADKFSIDEMMPYIEQCSAIGEIGLDSVWCDVPLEKQRDVFVKQLDIAQRRKVPVILHTKGQEKEIAEIIQNYDLTFFIHWYSCENYLELYLNKGYYFSIGPDIDKEKAVQNVALKVPIDHLLIETDGIESIAWATGKEAKETDVPLSLQSTLNSVAALRNMNPIDLQDQINKNWMRLFKNGD